MSPTSTPRRRRRDPQRPTKGGFSARSLALPIAAVAAVAAIAWLIVTAVKLFEPAGDVVAVPSFSNMSYDDAVGAAKAARVGVRIVARKPDFHAPKDSVVGQLPAAGEHVRVGRVIDLVVSDGQPTTKVPNVADMSVRDATVTLENAKVDVGTVTASEDTDVAAGTVLDQRPEALSEVVAGTRVDLVVAKGRPIVYAPNFVGMSEREASSAAKEAGVDLASPVPLALAPSAPPKGVVAAQDPPAGTELKPREKIELQISGGPIPTAPPSPTPLPLPSPEAQGASPSANASPLLPSPAAARGLRVSVALPQADAPTRIRVLLLDATGSRTLYDQQTKGGFTLTFDLTVTGAGTLQTYVGDTLVNSTSL